MSQTIQYLIGHNRPVFIFVLTVTLMILLADGSYTPAQVPLPTSAVSTPQYIRAPRLGITFISSIEHPASEERYRNALVLGAGWNRYPVYWDRIESAPGVYNWNDYDRLVSDDIRHGLSVNAILLGRPSFYTAGNSIQGLDEAIFTDGTDEPGAGKSLNAANHWAVFVFQVVTRYKPGGLLASQLGWQAGAGITVWEAWNEPDFPLFWNASPTEYARLLKVAYIVAHLADPNARVMFGGLAYGNPDTNDWLALVLEVFQSDPLRSEFNWFMDIVGVHSYSDARRTGLVVESVVRTLRGYGVERPVWVNESGVPVWDDYPGPVWTSSRPEERLYRATAQQAAAFFIQSTVWAWAEGAEVVFFHQLYDDCGNQAGGTDFPPNNGEICSVGACAGDAFGLYRNGRDNGCYSQHPLPGTPRPAASAYRLLAQVFSAAPFEGGTEIDAGSGITAIAFDRVGVRERIVVLWNDTIESQTAALPALGDNAQLLSTDITRTDGNLTLFPDAEHLYHITLPPAPRDDAVTGIGGAPYILIERVNEVTPTPSDSTPSLLEVTLGPVITPTLDPALDISPPTASVLPLPEVSPVTFQVAWSGEDDSGIARYLIWVRVDGGDWQPWIETARNSEQYTGVSGSTYEFAAWAVDLAGNWSSNTDLIAQAVTRVE